MARRFITCAIILLVTMAASGKINSDVEQATSLAERLSPRLAGKIQFQSITADEGRDVFTLESRGRKVIIGGNNANSMAVGLNR